MEVVVYVRLLSSFAFASLAVSGAVAVILVASTGPADAFDRTQPTSLFGHDTRQPVKPSGKAVTVKQPEYTARKKAAAAAEAARRGVRKGADTEASGPATGQPPVKTTAGAGGKIVDASSQDQSQRTRKAPRWQESRAARTEEIYQRRLAAALAHQKELDAKKKPAKIEPITSEERRIIAQFVAEQEGHPTLAGARNDEQAVALTFEAGKAVPGTVVRWDIPARLAADLPVRKHARWMVVGDDILLVRTSDGTVADQMAGVIVARIKSGRQLARVK